MKVSETQEPPSLPLLLHIAMHFGQTQAHFVILMLTVYGLTLHGLRKSGRTARNSVGRGRRICYFFLYGVHRMRACSFGMRGWDRSIMSSVRVSHVHFLHLSWPSLAVSSGISKSFIRVTYSFFFLPIGSFFGGSPSTISWWRDLYFTYHNHYLSQDIFVGKDQTLINALFLLNPKRIISVWLFDPIPDLSSSNSLESVPNEHGPTKLARRDNKTPLGLCGSTWYYYQFFLASASEREAMAAIWGSFSPFKFWQWDWWTVRKSVTRQC